ncbi:MAG: cysteine desulfurase [Clostridia bacterium]|nr:cysteine desulfurase [Clostridia bacterium]
MNNESVLTPVYADNAATTKLGPAALRAMIEACEDAFANPSSPHTPGQRAAKLLWASRERIAACIGADAREITFTSGGTEADNLAVLTAAAGEKRHIISTVIEHHAVLRPLERLRRRGYEIELLPVGKNGIVDLEDLRRALRPDTALVSVMTANNEIGTVQPIREIGGLCRAAGVPFHTDAVQAAGHLPIDVRGMNTDLLSASAHKFHGPKGVGFLYARRGTELYPQLLGGSQERGKRAGTENLPAIAGMAAALEEAVSSMAENNAKTARLRDRIIAGILSAVPGARLNGDREKRLANNLNIMIPGANAEAMILLLDGAGIAVSSGAACASGAGELSHVLTAIGLAEEDARCCLRITPGEDLTEAQAEYIVAAVARAAQRIRSI